MQDFKEKEASLEEVHAIMRKYLDDTPKTPEQLKNPYKGMGSQDFRENTQNSVRSNLFSSPKQPSFVPQNNGLYEAKRESDEALNKLINVKIFLKFWRSESFFCI